MHRSSLLSRSFISTALVVLFLSFVPRASAQPAVIDTANPAGVLRTITLDGEPIDLENPFFKSLGTNGRSCSSCHVASAGWTITPAEVRDRFARREADPIFRTK